MALEDHFTQFKLSQASRLAKNLMTSVEQIRRAFNDNGRII